MSAFNDSEIIDIFVPGRLCILGEHTDWAGEYRSVNQDVPYGMTLVCATNQGIHAKVCPHTAGYFLYKISTENDGKSFEIRVDKDELQRVASEGGFYSYVSGTVLQLLNKYSINIKAAEIGVKIDNYKSSLPMRKGLSSSAAICVMVASCFNEFYLLKMTRSDIMEIAYLGEMSTPSRCGRMDQCVAMGPGRVGFMEFDASHCELSIIHCNRELHFVVADLNSSKDTVRILRDLNDCFPVPVSKLQACLYDYVLYSQDLMWQAVEAIEKGDVDELARTMTRSQSLFDLCAVPACPSELTAPRLRHIIGHPEVRKLCLAAKGVGSQGDGTAQMLCRDQASQRQLVTVLAGLGCDAFPLSVPASGTDKSVEDTGPLLLHEQRVNVAVLVVPDESSVVPSTKAIIACGVRRVFLALPSAAPPAFDSADAVSEYEQQLTQIVRPPETQCSRCCLPWPASGLESGGLVLLCGAPAGSIPDCSVLRAFLRNGSKAYFSREQANERLTLIIGLVRRDATDDSELRFRKRGDANSRVGDGVITMEIDSDPAGGDLVFRDFALLPVATFSRSVCSACGGRGVDRLKCGSAEALLSTLLSDECTSSISCVGYMLH